MPSQARNLHQQSLEARERDGDFSKSLHLSDDALIEYLKENDKKGASEIIANRSITLRHLHQQTSDESYLLLARAELQAAVEITKTCGDDQAVVLPLFELAKLEEALQDYEQAIKHYQKAIDVCITDRETMIPNMQVHLHYAEYKHGDKSAKERLLAALEKLEQANEVDVIAHKVWISGGYLSLAEMLASDEPDQAKRYLDKAKKHITDDKKMHLRERQWKRLREKFN